MSAVAERNYAADLVGEEAQTPAGWRAKFSGHDQIVVVTLPDAGTVSRGPFNSTALRPHSESAPPPGPPAEEIAWISPTIHRLRQVKSLEDNWDRQGGIAPTGPSIKSAVRFLEQAMGLQTGAPSIVPVSDGGLQLEWHRGGFDVEIRFDGNGAAEELYIHDLSTAREWEGPWQVGFSEFDLARRLSDRTDLPQL